jgi:cytochrome c peroxidase
MTAALGSSVGIDQAAFHSFRPISIRMESIANPSTAEKVELGRLLYFDKRLSKNHDVSCNSCHGLNTYGVDNQMTSMGHRHQFGQRNSPTVYNAAGHFVQFWDGRAADVEAQAKAPVLNPIEMAMANEAAVLAVLASIPGYVEGFAKAFPTDSNPITYDNFAKAIGAFERNLVTPSRWDEFLGGDDAALGDEEKVGFNTFLALGCAQCHQGEFIGGSMYEKLGKVEPWPETDDLGRGAISKHESDNLRFKVPSLRNVEKTAPYFHDGSIASLPQAVRLMGKHQLGKSMSEQEVTSVVRWFGSLTGKLPHGYIQEPNLPASSATTPKADPS